MSFTRRYNSGTELTLTAPATAGGGSFFRWTKDGELYTSNAEATLTVSGSTTMEAEYTRTLCSGGGILATPDIAEGLVGGIGHFKKTSGGVTHQGLVSLASIQHGALQVRFTQNFYGVAGLMYAPGTPYACSIDGWAFRQGEHNIDFNPNFFFLHQTPLGPNEGFLGTAEPNSTGHSTADVFKLIVDDDNVIRWYKNGLPKDGGGGSEESPKLYDGTSPLYFFVILEEVGSEIFIDRFDSTTL